MCLVGCWRWVGRGGVSKFVSYGIRLFAFGWVLDVCVCLCRWLVAGADVLVMWLVFMLFSGLCVAGLLGLGGGVLVGVVGHLCRLGVLCFVFDWLPCFFARVCCLGLLVSGRSERGVGILSWCLPCVVGLVVVAW